MNKSSTSTAVQILEARTNHWSRRTQPPDSLKLFIVQKQDEENSKNTARTRTPMHQAGVKSPGKDRTLPGWIGWESRLPGEAAEGDCGKFPSSRSMRKVTGRLISQERKNLNSLPPISAAVSHPRSPAPIIPVAPFSPASRSSPVQVKGSAVAGAGGDRRGEGARGCD